MIKYPQTAKFHKKSAELQFNLKRPEDITADNGDVTSKAGCIFMDIAKPLNDGSDKMDWKNKITMKLDSRDIASLIVGVRTTKKASLFHKVEKEGGVTISSTLNVEPGEGETYKWFVGKTIGDNKQYTTIFLDKNDMFLAFSMLEAALPIIYGWME